MNIYRLYKDKTHKIAEAEPLLIDRVRAKCVIDTLFASALVLLFICVSRYTSLLNFSLSKSFFVFVFTICCLLTTIHFKSWRLAAHIGLFCNSLLVYTDVFIPSNTPDFILAQHAFITVFLSLFLVNYRYGIVYSLISIVGFSIVVLNRDINHPPCTENDLSAFLVTTFSFFIIVFVFYRFLNTLYKLINEAESSRLQEKSLNEQLQEKALIAKKSASAKNEFLSTISQQLRTPLNSIIGFTNLIIEDNPQKEQTEKLDLLLFSAEGLLSLVNDVIDYNQIDAGSFKLESNDFQLIPLIVKIQKGLKIKADKKEIDLQLHYDEALSKLSVMGDAIRIAQVIYNLTDNAIKFTKQGSVSILLKLLAKDKDKIKVEFEIKDTGIGIDSKKIASVFKPFTQADANTTREYGGTGLGLTIVENVLQAQGSKIICSSKLNKGTSFTFMLNFQLHHQISKIENIHQDQTHLLQGMKILLSENDKINNVLMGKILTGWQVNYDIAVNDIETLEYCKSNDYQLILMEVNIFGSRSLNTVQQIKNNKPHQKIILLTADSKISVIETVNQMGFDGFLLKPFNINELKTVLLTQVSPKI